MRTKGKYRRGIVLLCLLLALCFGQSVYAKENTEELNADEINVENSEDEITEDSADVEMLETGSSDTAKNGIVQVNSVYLDENGVSHVVYSSTGFIIGTEEKQYVITCNHGVNIPDEYKANAFTYYGISNENDEWNRISLQTKIVVEGDVVLDASCVNSSADLDIAVLELSQPIYTRTPLTILSAKKYDIEKLPYKVGESVYALGYPGSNTYDVEPIFYSDSQISMTVGSIVNLVNMNNKQSIEHTAAIGNNNCGGPLVTEDGYVIGVNTLDTDGVYYVAVDSTKLTKILDGLGVEYEKTLSRPVEEQEEEPVQQPVSEPKVPVLLIVVGAVVILAIIGGIIVLIVLLVNKNSDGKEKKKAKQEIETQNTNSALSQYLDDAQKRQPVINQVNYAPVSNGSETMVLNGGSNGIGTSVLGLEKTTSGQLKLGTLIRRKSGEQIPLNKSFFTIGKDSLHVDYCIKDNGTISRQHVVIRADEKGVLLEDCNSTNGTFLNGTRLSGGQAVILRAGDSVRLANEEFEYQAK